MVQELVLTQPWLASEGSHSQKQISYILRVQDGHPQNGYVSDVSSVIPQVAPDFH